MQKVVPFLMFIDQSEAAMNFYLSVFDNARILRQGRGADGRVNSGTFEIEGQLFHCYDGGPMFSFAQGFSLFVSCETQAEVDALWDRLSAGGEIQRCGWLKDRFGVSWQIIPTILGKGLQDKDPARAQRVMQAMLGMKKLDIAALEQAYNG
jgi:predicted 3-demethylubiquinone-9 3-methyltransferase (glyoxalase superfamily)